MPHELKLKEGDLAPTFTAQTNGGQTVSLVDFAGRPVILYFYPRDDTPGCTKEACAFRDGFAVLHYTLGGKVPVRPRLIGKAATVLQMVTVSWALLKWPLDWLTLLAIATAVCTGVSGVIYVLDGMKLLSASPDSSPVQKNSSDKPPQ